MAKAKPAVTKTKVTDRPEPKLANNINLFGDVVKPSTNGLLAQKFVYPPFSVLNARDGNWQSRKRGWLGLGIQSEVGRGADLTRNIDCDGHSRHKEREVSPTEFRRQLDRATAKGAMPAMKYDKGKRGDSHGRAIQPRTCVVASGFADGTRFDRSGKGVDEEGNSYDKGVNATSVFDPVLCELAYTWWCPPGGQVLDPFAGGSVRGIVASILGLKYWGSDLSGPQLAANREQAARICKDAPHQPAWVQGDSAVTLDGAPAADFIFSCPPYGNLEVYSDHPNDLSNKAYDEFLPLYSSIISKACQRLKPGGMACFVVGDFRDADGYYMAFVEDTGMAFRAAGLEKYNEAVLLTAIGSLPVRTSAQFESGRKLGKAHQNVLVFIKPN